MDFASQCVKYEVHFILHACTCIDMVNLVMDEFVIHVNLAIADNCSRLYHIVKHKPGFILSLGTISQNSHCLLMYHTIMPSFELSECVNYLAQIGMTLHL